MVNYIPDLNRFNLAGPPVWWLHQLALFDDSLVVLPSRMGWYYRLAQRRPPSIHASIAREAMKEQADTIMFASYGLVPVTTITATANWANPILFEELRARCPSMLGGADKVNANLDAQDAARDAAKTAATDAMLTDLSKDSWKLYLKKIGLRSQMWSPTTKRTATGEQAKSPGLIIKG